jgi:hypothetical protein
MRSNSVHGRFPLWDSPLVFEIFPDPSTQSCSNPRPGQVRFHHSSHKSGTFLFRALNQSCSLGNLYVRDIMSGHSRAPIFRGGGGDHCHDLKATFHIPLHPGIHLGWNIRKPLWRVLSEQPLPLIYLRTLQHPRSMGEFCNTEHTFFDPGTSWTWRPG